VIRHHSPLARVLVSSKRLHVPIRRACRAEAVVQKLTRDLAVRHEVNFGMKLLRLSAATLVAACLISACATRPIIVGQVRPPISPEAVRIYQVPPRHFERIAIIDSPAGTSWIFPDRPSMELGISRLREQAAAVGANGILLQRVYDVAAGGLSIGAGGFGYGGHSFYGGGGNVGGPLINHRVEAAAIYVR
jgi:hypothetical protein